MNLILVAALSIGSATLPDGSLIFLENSNRIVARRTDSQITHAAIAMNENGVTWIYEADQPEVRRWKLSDYWRAVDDRNKTKRGDKIKIIVLRPKIPYTRSQIRAMKLYLDSALGTPYSIRGYLRNQPVSGLHCSELVVYALQKSGRFKFQNPNSQTPIAIFESIKEWYE